VAKQIAREVLLELAGQMFPTHLIVLDGQGIDVILGMSWMKVHKAILDIAKWLVCIDSPIYVKVTLHLPVVIRLKEALKKKILDEAHTSRYSIPLGSTKMYHDLREQFWWTRMKREIALYVSECDTCRKVKADYMKPGGLLQPLSISDCKWEHINMDFIVGLPLTACKFDSIWVIVDRFTKSACFIHVHTHYTAERYVEIYITRVLCLHGVPKMIVSDRGS
jgi:hypothetical protein